MDFCSKVWLASTRVTRVTTLQICNWPNRCPQVSWIRRRDWHILTAGTKVFTKDARFQLMHSGAEWTLVVKYLQQRDEGTYVCQVKRISKFGKKYDIISWTREHSPYLMGSITVRLTSCLDLTKQVKLLVIQHKHSSWIQTKWTGG